MSPLLLFPRSTETQRQPPTEHARPPRPLSFTPPSPFPRPPGRNETKKTPSLSRKTKTPRLRFAAANSVSYVAPSLGAWLGYTSTTSAAATAAAAAAAAATAATTGAASGAGSVGAFSAVSGAAGAGVAGYKMTRRTAGVSVKSGGALLFWCRRCRVACASACVRVRRVCICVCVCGSGVLARSGERAYLSVLLLPLLLCCWLVVPSLMSTIRYLSVPHGGDPDGVEAIRSL